MAKALIGHLGSDLRSAAPLHLENLRLRTRLADLESLVLRLQAENDLLAAALREESRLGLDEETRGGLAKADRHDRYSRFCRAGAWRRVDSGR